MARRGQHRRPERRPRLPGRERPPRDRNASLDAGAVTRAGILPPPGLLVDLTCVPDGPPARAIVGLVQTLWPVVRPLGVDLVTATGNRHLRGADAPPWVDVRPTLGLRQREEQVAELT